MPHVIAWDANRADPLIDAELDRARAFFGADGEGASALLPVLHAMQHHFGFVWPEAVPHIAHRLNLSKADVRGVLSFYHDFPETPPGRHVLKLCRAEACQSVGSERVAAHLASAHTLTPGATAHGVTLQNVYCLGNCALGPAAMIDEQLLSGFDELTADLWMSRLQDGAP